MNTILVPTDFSDSASNAIEYAAHICMATHRSLLMLHVHQEIDYDPETKLAIIRDSLTTTFAGINCNYLIVSGDNLSEQIADTAWRLDIDLIVMGTREHSNFEKLVFGSNTAAVIEKAKCMVLSIPYGRHYKAVNRILFATTFEHPDLHSALDLVALAKAFDASIVIGHVSTDLERREIQKAKLRLFYRNLCLLSGYSKITFRFESANTVAMGLDALVDITNADVLALSTHRRNILEKILNPSITQKFAEHADIPLLAFHYADERY